MSDHDDEGMDEHQRYEYNDMRQQQQEALKEFKKELRNNREDGDQNRDWNEEEVSVK